VRQGGVVYNRKVLAIVTLVGMVGITMQLLSGAMGPYWQEVVKSYTEATRQAAQYWARGGTAYVIRDNGFYHVIYRITIVPPTNLGFGATIKLVPEVPIPGS